MAQIENITYKDWMHFKSEVIKDLFNDTPFKRGSYIFRGQASPEWKLQTSVDRCFAGLSTANQKSAFDDLLQYFKSECQTSANLSGEVLNDEMKILALGQHYGLPTTLLDWSDSPYVASFFAFSDAISIGVVTKYVTVWALDSTLTDVWS